MTVKASGPAQSRCFRGSYANRAAFHLTGRSGQSIYKQITSDHPVAGGAALGACCEEYFGPL